MNPVHAKPSLYAFYFEVLKEIALKYGYNLVLHGSMNRDLDLIAIPWSENIGDKESMIDEFCEVIGGKLMMHDKSVENINGLRYTNKPHGRMCYIININRRIELKHDGFVVKASDHADPQYYIDISIIPTL